MRNIGVARLDASSRARISWRLGGELTEEPPIERPVERPVEQPVAPGSRSIPSSRIGRYRLPPGSQRAVPALPRRALAARMTGHVRRSNGGGSMNRLDGKVA